MVGNTAKCPCKKKTSSAKIECKLCSQWWHSNCVSLKGLKVEDLDKLTDWICPICYTLPESIPHGKLETLIKAECNTLKRQHRQLDATCKSIEAAVKEEHLVSVVSKVVEEKMKKQVESVKETIQQNNTRVFSEVVQSSKAQMDADTVARQQRKCNLVIRNVSEPTGDTDNSRRQEDLTFAMKCLNIDREQIIRVTRVGKPIGHYRDERRVSRPLIITVETPELAAYLHDYGRGWRRQDDFGDVYWVNQDLIAADREANYKARVEARRRRQGGPIILDELNSTNRSRGSTRSHAGLLSSSRVRSASRSSTQSTATNNSRRSRHNSGGSQASQGLE